MANIIEITEFMSPELDVYARLTENQLLNRHEPEKGLFIAESPNVVERALNAGYTPVSLLLERKHITRQAAHIIDRCGDIPVYTADFDVLTQLTGFQLTRGVLCAMHRKPLPDVREICAGARRIAILENVMNPTNVGAIFRSAAALNMDAVLLTPACSNPLYRRSPANLASEHQHPDRIVAIFRRLELDAIPELFNTAIKRRQFRDLAPQTSAGVSRPDCELVIRSHTRRIKLRFSRKVKKRGTRLHLRNCNFRWHIPFLHEHLLRHIASFTPTHLK